jgi:hypothetical protein
MLKKKIVNVSAMQALIERIEETDNTRILKKNEIFQDIG